MKEVDPCLEGSKEKAVAKVHHVCGTLDRTHDIACCMCNAQRSIGIFPIISIYFRSHLTLAKPWLDFKYIYLVDMLLFLIYDLSEGFWPLGSFFVNFSLFNDPSLGTRLLVRLVARASVWNFPAQTEEFFCATSSRSFLAPRTTFFCLMASSRSAMKSLHGPVCAPLVIMFEYLVTYYLPLDLETCL